MRREFDTEIVDQLPAPTLVAVIQGMNFTHAPELSWTYASPLAVAVMAGGAALPHRP